MKPAKKPNPASNSQTVINGYISEALKFENELLAPKAALKDIYASAKDAGFNIVAIKNAVKFKMAESEKQEAIRENLKATDLYLSFSQLSLF